MTTTKRRVAFLVLVLGIVVVARFGFRRPVDVELLLQLGPGAASLRAVDLVISDAAGRVARDVHLVYLGGAPAEERRHLPLLPGLYTVAAHLHGATDLPLVRSLDVAAAGTYPISLEGDGLP